MTIKTLPAFTSVGSYPILYLTPCDCVLCAKCATESEEPVTGHPNWETPATCDECSDEIECAYPAE